MALGREKLYTIDDIYSLSDGERAELIDGQIYYMAPPSRKHQEILSFLHLTIGNHIANNNVKAKYPRPFCGLSICRRFQISGAGYIRNL